jgi:tetratricopeptide (TPR) repeat protein
MLLRPSSNDIGTLLAQAYTQSRPFEYRLPDHGYSAAHAERSAGGSPLSKAPALLKADSMLSEQSSRDARWWRLRGTAELLHSNPEAAVESLTKARDQAPEDVEIAEALAVAYALRAEVSKHPSDFAFALDLLSAEARKHQTDVQILFNRALVLEQLKMTEEAIRQWQRYLKLDAKSEWANEARKHLQNLMDRRSLWERLHRQSGEDENSFLAHADPEHDDNYLERTALVWLSRVPQSDKAEQAVRRLAGLLYHRHKDLWLENALLDARRSDGASSVLTLADLNIRGEVDAAIRQAPREIGILERNGQTALAPRARLELVYALHRAAQPAECVKASEELERQIENRSFPWITIQNRMERAVCSMMLGHEGDSIREYKTLFRQAQDHGFLGISLRASGLTDDARTLAGDAWGAWKRSIAGLDEYWRSGTSPSRAHQLYFNMAFAATHLGLRIAATELAGAALEELHKVGNFPTEALGDVGAAELATKAGLLDDAAIFFEHAAIAESKASASETMRRYQWLAELSRTQMELDRGEIVEARNRLARLRGAWKDTPAAFAVQLSKEILEGNVAFRSGDYADARQHLVSAVSATEKRLVSLKTETERVRVLEYAGESIKALMQVVLAEERDPAEALDLWLSFRTGGPSMQGRKYRAGQETWLIYTVLGNRVAAWLKDAKGVLFRWLPSGPAEIAREAKLALGLASEADSNVVEIHRISSALYGKLIGPFTERIAGPIPLMIIADAELGEVPFGLLETERGEFLGDAHAIVLCGRFSRDILQNGVVTKSSPALVIAQSTTDAVDSERVPPLPQAGYEARSVAARFSHAKLLDDGAVTPLLIRSLAPGLEVFHFSGHGFSNSGNGALMLSSTLLTSEEILQSNWKLCKIAVLSACLTGAGESRGPVNPNSLVRAFLVSGAKSVVATQWNIDSGATRDFMDSFYTRLMDGASIPDALKLARRTIRTAPAYTHPYYWGAFAGFQ